MMNNSPAVFNFGAKSIRTIEKDGEPWFVARDISDALGYVWNGTARVMHIPEEWRGVTSVVTPSGKQDVIVISEPGVFFFLNRSDKAAALPMQKWVAGEVLPSIRKTGGYIAEPPLPADPILAQIEIIKSVREKQLELESNLNETRHEVDHLKQNMRVENWQQCNLKKAVTDKVNEFIGLYPHIKPKDMYPKIWSYFKKKFSIPRYQELPAMRYDEGLRTIQRLAMHNLAGL